MGYSAHNRNLEGEERERGIENIFEEIMAENVPNLKKETDIQKQEAQRFPSKMTQNRPMSGHIVIKMAKVKDKENSKGGKSKTKSHIQKNLHKAVS